MLSSRDLVGRLMKEAVQKLAWVLHLMQSSRTLASA
jgi:hypothetical protein